ncbi:recombinase family protein [Clostridium botulinum]|nr:recombinase family protein [Clostridium botulinum]NFI02504.1 recombinase family protein [Clostridium botulinum]NFI64975.1 recombinase family protein [Clostridium botulinum]NFI80265.1 recombinase family protein [Clostridium botulinum]NFJ42170.1 recombinase family protein [Clostridium botulinum]
MKKSAIYVRVSTNHQIDKDSLPLQKNDMINYSKYVLGIDDYEIFEDAGYSGKNTDRPDFQKMFKRIKNGEFTHLLVWKIDRISRNLLDFCSMYDALKKYGCTFISKNEQFDTSTAMGEAMLKIILVFAELERKLTAERVKATMLDRASRGLWNGAPIPLGYKWDDKIKFPVIDEDEKETVMLIYTSYSELQSTSAVRNLLNNLGVQTKRNGTWSTKTISDIIRNPFYKGTYRYNYRETARGKKKKENEWIVLDNNHEAIIYEEFWVQCNEIMDKNSNKNNAKFRGNSNVHIFSGLIECGECHSTMYAKQDKPNLDGYRPSLYACKSRYNGLGCTQKTISDKIVGTFVLSFISNMIRVSNLDRKNLDKGKVEKMLLVGKSFNNVYGIKEIDTILNSLIYAPKNLFTPIRKSTEKNKESYDIKKLDTELKKYEKGLSRLEDLYLFDECDMSQKDYILKTNKINDKISEIKERIDQTIALDMSSCNYDFLLNATTLEFSKEISNGNVDLKALIQRVDRNIIKEFVNTLINKIIVKNKEVQSIEFKNGLVVTFIYNL